MLVGMEGIYGIGTSLILLTVLQFSPMISVTHNIVKLEEYSPIFSSFSKNENNNDYVWQQLADTTAAQWTNSIQNKTQIESYFVNNHHNNFNVPFDDILLTFRQLLFSSACFFTILFYILAGAFYNFCQISIIKHLSAGAAVMMGSLRNISVWCVCLVLPIFGESFNIIQFLGFIGLVVGNIFFQNVWIKTFDEILPKNVVDRFSFFLKDYEKASDVMITEEMEMTEDARKDSTTEVLPF
ncbi:hypothetical protein AGDE_14613 [Angomonas deanei]|nr:hypothetical protein AGDE_14613 [Angomonas deanei]|eukprot:EPY20548.1 hypothetical protein AGDE_14613 [Angomonas deanei]